MVQNQNNLDPQTYKGTHSVTRHQTLLHSHQCPLSMSNCLEYCERFELFFVSNGYQESHPRDASEVNQATR